MSDESVTMTEVKKQSVILVFTILGAVILIYVSPFQHDAAARERFVMRSALRVKRFAQWNADLWTTVALEAGTVYNRNRTA